MYNIYIFYSAYLVACMILHNSDSLAYCTYTPIHLTGTLLLILMKKRCMYDFMYVMLGLIGYQLPYKPPGTSHREVRGKSSRKNASVAVESSGKYQLKMSPLYEQ